MSLIDTMDNLKETLKSSCLQIYDLIVDDFKKLVNIRKEKNNA